MQNLWKSEKQVRIKFTQIYRNVDNVTLIFYSIITHLLTVFVFSISCQDAKFVFSAHVDEQQCTDENSEQCNNSRHFWVWDWEDKEENYKNLNGNILDFVSLNLKI